MVILSRAIVERSLIRPVSAVVMAISLVIGCISTGGADGPWRGQIIDAATSRPVSGVVVLMVWWRRFPGAVHEGRELYEAKEAVTDADGRFVVPRVDTRLANPLHRIDGPKLQVFKSAYSSEWRFLDEPTPGRDIQAEAKWLADAWRRFEQSGVVITIMPVAAGAEQLRAPDGPAPGIPPEKAPLFWRAYQEELGRREMKKSPQ